MQHSRQLDSAPKFPAREQGNQRRRGNTLTPELIIRLSLRKLLISNSRLETLHRLQLHYLANSRSEQRELHANSCMPRTFVSRQSIYARSINDRCRSHIPRKLLSPAHDKFCSLRLRKIVISLRGGRARGRLSYTAAFIWRANKRKEKWKIIAFYVVFLGNGKQEEKMGKGTELYGSLWPTQCCNVFHEIKATFKHFAVLFFFSSSPFFVCRMKAQVKILVELWKIRNNCGVSVTSRPRGSLFARRIPSREINEFPRGRDQSESRRFHVTNISRESPLERTRAWTKNLGSYTLAINPTRCWLCGLNPSRALFNAKPLSLSPSPRHPVFHRFSVVRRGRLLAPSSSVCVYRVCTPSRLT